MFYAKLNYLHEDRGMTLTVFQLQNPVRCDKLRKPVADQREQRRLKVKPMQNSFLSPLWTNLNPIAVSDLNTVREY